MSEFDYQEPLALVIISSISIGIAAIFAGWLALGIILRRGWRSMMLIMIPVYVINALYLWPITLWAYVKYGRPPKPGSGNQGHCHDKMGASDGQMTHQQEDDNKETEDTSEDLNASQHAGDQHHAPNDEEKAAEAPAEGHAHMYHGSSDRPMFATVTIGVCHCGAGCVLGDIVGEWIVYGAGVSIGDPPRELWVNYLLGRFSYDAALLNMQPTNFAGCRLRFRLRLRHRLPVLFDRAYGRRVRTQNCYPRSESRCLVTAILRSRFVLMDGSVSDWHLPMAATDEHSHVLVDDADWHVHWSLDWCSDQLVADNKGYQRTLRLMMYTLKTVCAQNNLIDEFS